MVGTSQHPGSATTSDHAIHSIADAIILLRTIGSLAHRPAARRSNEDDICARNVSAAE
jgi:hypothetical protein